MNRRLVDFLRMRFLPISYAGVALLVGCGSGETPASAPVTESAMETTEPATTPAPVPAPAPAVQTETPVPAVEPAKPITPPPAEPVVEVNSVPAVEEPVAVASKPVESTESAGPKIKLSEDLATSETPPVKPRSTASIRSALKERFVEERELKLVETRWHILGEPEPYTGQAKSWSVEGWKEREGRYKNGLQEGRWRSWWDNGLIRSAVYMKNGNPAGEAIYWHKNGQRKSEGNWVKGKFVATAKWNEAGDPIPVE